MPESLVPPSSSDEEEPSADVIAEPSVAAAAEDSEAEYRVVADPTAAAGDDGTADGAPGEAASAAGVFLRWLFPPLAPDEAEALVSAHGGAAGALAAVWDEHAPHATMERAAAEQVAARLELSSPRKGALDTVRDELLAIISAQVSANSLVAAAGAQAVDQVRGGASPLRASAYRFTVPAEGFAGAEVVLQLPDEAPRLAVLPQGVSVGVVIIVPAASTEPAPSLLGGAGGLPVVPARDVLHDSSFARPTKGLNRPESLVNTLLDALSSRERAKQSALNREKAAMYAEVAPALAAAMGEQTSASLRPSTSATAAERQRLEAALEAAAATGDDIALASAVAKLNALVVTSGGGGEDSVERNTRDLAAKAAAAKKAYVRAKTHVRAKRWADAVADSRSALELGHPNSALVLACAAFAHYSAGELHEAFSAYDRCIALTPKPNVHMLASRGILNQHFGRWAAAIADFEAVLVLDATDEGVRVRLGAAQRASEGATMVELKGRKGATIGFIERLPGHVHTDQGC